MEEHGLVKICWRVQLDYNLKLSKKKLLNHVKK